MKKLLLALCSIVAAGLIFSACQKDVQLTQSIPDEVLHAVAHLGFNVDDIKEVEGGYLVEGDIFLTNEQLDQHLLNDAVPNLEQYRTTNLVTGLPRNIPVTVSSSLPSSYVTGVQGAIARYNAENLQITFSYAGLQANNYSAPAGSIHMKKGGGNFLASAGFPTAGGQPHNLVTLNSNAIGSGSTNTAISIIAHEMGHCIGMRHTDYYNRAISCGGAASNEGSAGVGAILIPGTPSTATNAANSWMLACIGAGVNRPFNADDQTALNYLY